MKDYLRQIIREKKGNFPKKGIVVEYLQARLLQSFQESGVFLDWAFHGGTALRFLYSIPRYSEDLDFALFRTDRKNRFSSVIEAALRMFEAEDYAVDIKIKVAKNVNSAFLRFRGLLYDLGISPHKGEVVSVKVELDTNPPVGASYETTLVRKHVTLNLFHHDRASLLAGKLHAILNRKYTKGRDIFDLVWFLSDATWPAPNLVLLNSALAQTGWKGNVVSAENWRNILIARLEGLDWKGVARDVSPFLERPNDLVLLTRENCVCLVRGK